MEKKYKSLLLSIITMKTFWLLLLISNIYSCFGQSTPKVVKLYDKKGNLITEYSIQKINNDTLFNGPYKSYYPNHKLKDSCYYDKGIIIGKEVFYDKKGRITFIHEYIGNSFPRRIKTKAYYFSGMSRYCEGNMLEIRPGKAVKDGIITYYYKNMKAFDSLVFKNDIRIYRARFNKKGILEYENKNPSTL